MTDSTRSLDAVPAAGVIVSRERADDPGLVDAIARARAIGLRVRKVGTASADENEAVIRELTSDGVETVIAAGGDGILSHVARALSRSEVEGLAIGVLPMGTANDFATACDLVRDDLFESLMLAMTLPAVGVDLVRANDRPFINVATMGSVANLTTEIDPKLKKVFGRLAYACLGLMNASNAEGIKTEVVTPSMTWTGETLGVMIANGRDAGGGFTVSRSSLLNDGLFDGLVVADMSMSERVRVGFEMKHRQLDHDRDGVLAWQDQRTTVRFDKPVAMKLDGEEHEADEITFTVQPEAVSLRLPSRAPSQ